MARISIKISSNYRITLTQIVRKKLNIKKGDRLLVDIHDGMIILIPNPKRYTEYLRGLHSDIWKGIEVQNYINGERESWTNSTND